QSAISSGDRNLTDSALNTFNPIYPKGIYYGYIDNVGSANIFLTHLKMEVEPFKKLKLTADYFKFWRQSVADGLYATSGSFLVAPGSDQRGVGSIIDILASYTYSSHLSLRGIVSYFKRDSFLIQDPTTPHDIRSISITVTLRL